MKITKQILLCVASAGITFALCLPVLAYYFKSETVGTIYTDKAKLYGWALPPSAELLFDRPGVECYKYRTNSQGWKDVEHSFTRDSRKRILVIGDSFTFGYPPIDRQYTRVLQHLLGNDYEVISIGVGGWGTDQELAAYENEGRLYKPDIVILQFCANDIADNLRPSKNLLSGVNRIGWKKPFRFFVEGGILRRYEVVKGENPPEFHDGDGWALTSKILVRFKDMVERDGSRFAVFHEGIGNPYRLPYDPHVELKAVCRRASIELIHPYYASYQRYEKNVHTNARGNAEMAEDIANFLRKQ